jgi:hypothetical protein
MRLSSGVAVFTVISAAAAIYFVFANRHSDPPPEYTALELTTGGAAPAPSCYTLQSVLVANNLTGTAKRTWSQRVKNEWTLRIDNGRDWRSYRFTREGDLVVPSQVVSSDKLPQIGTQEAIDAWLKAAADKNAAKVQRCTGKSAP